MKIEYPYYGVVELVWRPLPHHLHVCLQVEDESDRFAHFGGGDGGGGGQVLGLADLAAVTAAKTADLMNYED